MRAAIYARKSTDDNSHVQDNKSVTRQVERARAYATAKGWTVDRENIFIDDGISGAEFKNRPALLRMLTLLKEFDVVITSELSRLGREQSQTANVLADIYAKGKRVFFYLTDEEVRFDSAIDKFMISAVAFGAELEREKASQRSRDALERKARSGYNTGGTVFGYTNVSIESQNMKGEKVRSHTDYAVNPAEAEVVRGIFNMFLNGHGHGAIAKCMNGEPRYRAQLVQFFGGRTPPSPRKGTGSWAPTSVRDMLHNERYTGKVPFGQFRKVIRGGTKARVKTNNLFYADRPDLTIIPPELWSAVQKRLADVRATYVRENGGQLWGRPPTGRASQYLLSGLARCGCENHPGKPCGASMIANPIMWGSPGKRKQIMQYICAYRKNRGRVICSNSVPLPMERFDAEVIEAIESSVLTPEIIMAAVRRAVEVIEAKRRQEPDCTKRIEADIVKLQKKIANLTAAIAEGQAPASVVTAISAHESELTHLKADLTRFAAQPALAELDRARLQRELKARISQFRSLLRDNVPRARQALGKLLDGPIWVTPTIDGYTFRGNTRVGALLPATSVRGASPRGFEPLLPP
jgi:DNA invertase Pin-like site-specific DNA recombinase